jgi:hypothetical protein
LPSLWLATLRWLAVLWRLATLWLATLGLTALRLSTLSALIIA